MGREARPLSSALAASAGLSIQQLQMGRTYLTFLKYDLNYYYK